MSNKKRHRLGSRARRKLKASRYATEIHHGGVPASLPLPDDERTEPPKPQIQSRQDLQLVDKLLKTPDWQIPEQATDLIPKQVMLLAIGRKVDASGKAVQDPSIDEKTRLAAARTMDSLVNTNLRKQHIAIAATQRAEAIEKGLVAAGMGASSVSVNVCVYIPERGSVAEFTVEEDEDTRERRRIEHGAGGSGNGNGRHP